MKKVSVLGIGNNEESEIANIRREMELWVDRVRGGKTVMVDNTKNSLRTFLLGGLQD